MSKTEQAKYVSRLFFCFESRILVNSTSNLNDDSVKRKIYSFANCSLLVYIVTSQSSNMSHAAVRRHIPSHLLCTIHQQLNDYDATVIQRRAQNLESHSQ